MQDVLSVSKSSFWSVSTQTIDSKGFSFKGHDFAPGEMSYNELPINSSPVLTFRNLTHSIHIRERKKKKSLFQYEKEPAMDLIIHTVKVHW